MIDANIAFLLIQISKFLYADPTMVYSTHIVLGGRSTNFLSEGAIGSIFTGFRVVIAPKHSLCGLELNKFLTLFDYSLPRLLETSSSRVLTRKIYNS